MGAKQYPSKRKHLKPWERTNYKKRSKKPKAVKAAEVQMVHDSVVVTVADLQAAEQAVHDWVKLPCQELPSVTSVLTKADIEKAVESLAKAVAKDVDKQFAMYAHPSSLVAHIGQYADFVGFSELVWGNTDKEVEGEEIFQCTMGWEYEWNQVHVVEENKLENLVKQNPAIEYYENLKKNMTFGGPW